MPADYRDGDSATACRNQARDDQIVGVRITVASRAARAHRTATAGPVLSHVTSVHRRGERGIPTKLTPASMPPLPVAVPIAGCGSYHGGRRSQARKPDLREATFRVVEKRRRRRPSDGANVKRVRISAGIVRLEPITRTSDSPRDEKKGGGRQRRVVRDRFVRHLQAAIVSR